MDTTVIAQVAVQHGISGWLVFLTFLCFLGFVYWFIFHPILLENRSLTRNTRRIEQLTVASKQTGHKRVRNSYPDTVHPDQRLIAEIRTILDQAKPLKEIRPADVRQHLNSHGWRFSEDRILRAMDDLRDIYYFIGHRWTSKGQLIIWRLPEQPADSLPAEALFYEDVK
jgi:hypothetical protein